jgi:hypothetical protein
MGEYVTLDNTFYKLVFKQEVVAAPVTPIFPDLLAFFEENFIRNIITILCVNYTI